MSQTDLEINRSIRRVLVRHWIDLGRVSSHTTGGNIFIHGSLLRIEGCKDELSPAIVEALFSDIRQIKDVRHVKIELDNWVNAAGGWISTEKATRERHAAKSFSGAQPSVYDIGKGSKASNNP